MAAYIACTIEDEHGVAHKVNKKAVFAKARKDAERIVAKAEYLLECFVKQERKIKPSRTPREHFAMEQTCRTAFELFFRVRKSRLGCDDIREGLENLAFLFDYLVVDSPIVAGASNISKENISFDIYSLFLYHPTMNNPYYDIGPI